MAPSIKGRDVARGYDTSPKVTRGRRGGASVSSSTKQTIHTCSTVLINGDSDIIVSRYGDYDSGVAL